GGRGAAATGPKPPTVRSMGARSVASTRLAPGAGSVSAADRKLDAASGAIGVHVALSCLYTGRDRQRFVDVARPDAGNEAVLRAIGDRDRLLHIVKSDHREHGAENLLLRDAHVGRDLVEERGLEVETVS